MISMVSSGTLQAATVITKTTQTLIGHEIPCGGYDKITLFFDYVNGDETTLVLQAHMLQATAGTEYQYMTWSATAGAKTMTKNTFSSTVTGSYYITFNIGGIEFIKFTQATADGTPTGTLAATYTMTS